MKTSIPTQAIFLAGCAAIAAYVPSPAANRPASRLPARPAKPYKVLTGDAASKDMKGPPLAVEVDGSKLWSNIVINFLVSNRSNHPEEVHLTAAPWPNWAFATSRFFFTPFPYGEGWRPDTVLQLPPRLSYTDGFLTGVNVSEGVYQEQIFFYPLANKSVLYAYTTRISSRPPNSGKIEDKNPSTIFGAVQLDPAFDIGAPPPPLAVKVVNNHFPRSGGIQLSVRATNVSRYVQLLDLSSHPQDNWAFENKKAGLSVTVAPPSVPLRHTLYRLQPGQYWEGAIHVTKEKDASENFGHLFLYPLANPSVRYSYSAS